MFSLLLSRLYPHLQRHRTLVRVGVLLGAISVIIYVAGNTVSFIVQLFDASALESVKFCKVIASLLNRPTLELEFLPQEFEELQPDENGFYAYAPANLHPLLFRRSDSVPGAWEWSDDGRTWFGCDNVRETVNGVPEPPTLLFLLRLHVEHLLRRRLSAAGAMGRRLPPPLDTTTPRPGRPLEAAPDALCCPISHNLMRVPVVGPSGTTFDFDYIRRWVLQHNTDPVNGAPLSEADLYPNLAVRDLVERWLEQGGGGGGTEGGTGGGTGGSSGSITSGVGGSGGLPPHLVDLS
ncbi:hypothetical protein HYH02_006859 [Chlamydomonas schloesseri]|uniref:U-box domain-containing protein n=1 Tax=Chlamydomonas schloesseri TaxID=2026947 RepID=A0A835WK18_9CHLO|nr:hypothetical protein HYH02_006859 [Chlamydomonas schloesseri]|eukprot:KAG2448275.1 hypothetical protein HYH02_006859 [Chlamydomonas schloesseri]